MTQRLLVLLAAGCLSCTGALASAAPARRHAAPAPRSAPRAPRAVPSFGRCPIPARFRPAFVRAARDTGFQLAMLVAVAQTESRFHPLARSTADARGLLQVLPSTGRSLRLDVNRPDENVLAGARYLRLLLDRYSSTDLAFAAYNAGPTAVDEAGGRAPTGETVAYVANVELRWRRLAGCR